MIHRAALPDGPATTSLQRYTSIVEFSNKIRVTATSENSILLALDFDNSPVSQYYEYISELINLIKLISANRC